jgi:hypothetical protein
MTRAVHTRFPLWPANRPGAQPGNQNASKARRERKAERERQEAKRRKRNNEPDKVRFVRHYGNDASYLLRRLKRDCPEVLGALLRGEYPSVRQAAIAAGIVKEPSPLDKARRAFEKLNPVERAQFLATVTVEPDHD